jgi:hypothetical protein
MNATKTEYSVYIITAFETEITEIFTTKKDMMCFLRTSLWTRKGNASTTIACAKEVDGDKIFVSTKFSKEGR